MALPSRAHQQANSPAQPRPGPREVPIAQGWGWPDAPGALLMGGCWDGPCLTHPRSPYGALIPCGKKINIPNFLLLQQKNTANESITFYNATAH